MNAKVKGKVLADGHWPGTMKSIVAISYEMGTNDIINDNDAQCSVRRRRDRDHDDVIVRSDWLVTNMPKVRPQ